MSRADRAALFAAKPLLRGWLHTLAFVAAVPAGILVISQAQAGWERAAVIVYAIGLAAVFGVSGTYHRRPWGPVAKERWQRADHATIFVMIAASYTPVCVIAMRGMWGSVFLGIAWAGATAGVIVAVSGWALRWFGSAGYIVLGWACTAALPILVSRMSGHAFALLVAGGLVYTLGAIMFGLKWPNPFPKVFGYHEVWHTMVVAAAAFHFALVLELARHA